jgi:hypothetical protein
MPRDYVDKITVTAYVSHAQIERLQALTGLNRSQVLAKGLDALESSLARPQAIDITTIEPKNGDLDGTEYPNLTLSRVEYSRSGLDPKGLLSDLEKSGN